MSAKDTPKEDRPLEPLQTTGYQNFNLTLKEKDLRTG
jgi:hypothetical protein